MDTRAIFHEKARKTIDFIFDTVETWENKMNHMTEDMKERLGPQLENLKTKLNELEKELLRLKNATSDSWEDAKIGFEKSLNILHKQIDKIREHFKHHEEEPVST